MQHRDAGGQRDDTRGEGEDRQRAEQRPRRDRPVAVERHQQQKGVSHEAEVEAVAEPGCGPGGRPPARRLSPRPGVTAEREQRHPRQHRQRCKHADTAGGVPPPRRQDDPRQRGSNERYERQRGRCTLDEESRVQDREQQRERPDSFRRDRTGGEEEQQRQAGDEDDAAAGLGPERMSAASGEQRHAERDQPEQRVDLDRGPQVCAVQPGGRPARLRRNREERCGVVQPACVGRYRTPRDPDHQREQDPERKPRRREDGIDPQDDREDEEEQRRGVDRVRARGHRTRDRIDRRSPARTRRAPRTPR